MFSCLVSVEEVRTSRFNDKTRFRSSNHMCILRTKGRIFVADKTFDRCNVDVKMQNGQDGNKQGE